MLRLSSLARAAALALTACVMGQAAAAASVTEFRDRAAFLGAGATLETETFNGVFIQTARTVMLPATGTTSTKIGPGADSPFTSNSVFGGLFVGDTRPGSNAFQFDFDTPVTAFGIDFSLNTSRPSLFATAMLAGMSRTFDVTAGMSRGFYGLFSDRAFDRLVFTTDPAGIGSLATFDNLFIGAAPVVAPVPLPAPIALLGAAIAGLGLLRRRSAARA